MKTLTKDEIMEAKFKYYANVDRLAHDFHSVFVKNEWKWSIWHDNSYRVPTEDEIAVTISSLCKDLYPGDTRSLVSTGRIVLEVTKSQFSEDIDVVAFLQTERKSLF